MWADLDYHDNLKVIIRATHLALRYRAIPVRRVPPALAMVVMRQVPAHLRIEQANVARGRVPADGDIVIPSRAEHVGALPIVSAADVSTRRPHDLRKVLDRMAIAGAGRVSVVLVFIVPLAHCIPPSIATLRQEHVW